MSKKLVLIGAGSAMFTQGLIVDIIKEQSLGPWEIRLVDIDPEALKVAYNLAKKMVKAKDAHVVIKQSTDRKDLLSGADIVITTIGVGGRRAWEPDVFIPRKYGIYQPVGDTVGPGGISRAMRMIPEMKEIARDILKLCPDALFINYSNPMTA
ncbi:alpha-glucosidase/alpha-galactosidase, partial [Candidatus Aerophobetes bacterium]